MKKKTDVAIRIPFAPRRTEEEVASLRRKETLHKMQKSLGILRQIERKISGQNGQPR